MGPQTNTITPEKRSAAGRCLARFKNILGITPPCAHPSEQYIYCHYDVHCVLHYKKTHKTIEDLWKTLCSVDPTGVWCLPSWLGRLLLRDVVKTIFKRTRVLSGKKPSVGRERNDRTTRRTLGQSIVVYICLVQIVYFDLDPMNWTKIENVLEIRSAIRAGRTFWI